MDHFEDLRDQQRLHSLEPGWLFYGIFGMNPTIAGGSIIVRGITSIKAIHPVTIGSPARARVLQFAKIGRARRKLLQNKMVRKILISIP